MTKGEARQRRRRRRSARVRVPGKIRSRMNASFFFLFFFSDFLVTPRSRCIPERVVESTGRRQVDKRGLGKTRATRGRGTAVGGRGDDACALWPSATAASTAFPRVPRFPAPRPPPRPFAAPHPERSPSDGADKGERVREKDFCRTFVLTPLQHLLDDAQAQRVIVDDEDPEADGEARVCDFDGHLARPRSARQTLSSAIKPPGTFHESSSRRYPRNAARPGLLPPDGTCAWSVETCTSLEMCVETRTTHEMMRVSGPRASAKWRRSARGSDGKTHARELSPEAVQARFFL